MQRDLIQKNKEKLEKEQERLKKTLSGIATKDPNVKYDYNAKYKDFGDPIFDDSAEAAEEALYDSNISVEGNLELQLRDVSQALDRIKDDNYGKCVECRTEISGKRLEARPAAKYCLKCVKKIKHK